jgi:hypothetical protein
MPTGGTVGPNPRPITAAQSVLAPWPARVPGGVDARMVVSVEGWKVDESQERRSPWPRPSGLLADRGAEVARGSGR